MGVKICPGCHNRMDLKKLDKKTVFRGVLVRYPSEAYVCPECGFESGTLKQAAMVQKLISDGYRKKMHLLTGDEIQKLREQKGISQGALADAVNVDTTRIKKWEGGLIQSKSMDQALRQILQPLK